MDKVKKLQEGLNLPHNRAHQKSQVSISSKKYWADPDHVKEFSIKKSMFPDFKVCEMFIKFFIKNNFPKRDDLFKLLSVDGTLLKYWKEQNIDKSISSSFKTFTKPMMKNIFRYMHIKDYPHFRIFCKNLPDVVNHKVAKIEYLTERDDTGCITVENNHNFAITFNLSDGSKSQVYVSNSILDNLFIPQSDNRGSDVTTIGGNSAGFTELDDVEYFAKKLYRSLKYPMSRIDNQMDSRSGDNLFGGASFSEITRDEIK
jgi:hypothetical protein